jgi:hypothetical protein
MAWGLSLVSGVGAALGLVGPVDCFGEVHCCYSYVTVFTSKRLHLPSLWARFLVLNAFGVGWFGLLSQKEKKKKKVFHVVQ